MSLPRAKVDSENVLPALLGTSKTARTVLVEQAGALGAQAGAVEVHRARARDRGSSRTRTPSSATIRSLSSTISTADPGERTNLAAARPEKVRELAALLDGIRRATQSPGDRPPAFTAILNPPK